MLEKSGNWPEERGQDLWNIVEMAWQTPVTIVKQDRSSDTLVSAVLGSDKFGWLAPNFYVTVGLSEDFSLSVTVKVDVNHKDAGDEKERRKRETQVDGMGCEVESVRGVDGWEENKASPADHVASSIVLDVHRSEVSCFPNEELKNVDELQANVD